MLLGARKYLQFEPLEKGRERTKLSMVTFDCVFLTQDNATWEYENEPNPEVFQEVKTYSCVEVAVRITDDIPLLNWIPHFAMKMRTGRRNVSCAIWRRGADVICKTHNFQECVCLST